MTPFTTLGELSPFPFVSGTLLYWHANALLPLLRLNVVTKFISSGSHTETGNCWGDQTRGCGVFIEGTSTEGKNCTISGNELWNDYQSIRKICGCKKRGSFRRDDGCLVKIDYVYGCDNH
jgi:hypothetical protein